MTGWLLEQLITRPWVTIGALATASAVTALLAALFRAQQRLIDRAFDPAWQAFTTAMRSTQR